MNNYRKRRPAKPFMALFFVLCIFLVGWIVMLLWNAILPEVMPVKRVSYWQAMGMLVLSKILFGGFGKFGGGGRFRNSAMEERFKHMTDEERERLKEEWRRRCRI